MKEEKAIVTYDTLKSEFKKHVFVKLPLYILLFILAIVILFKAISEFKEAFASLPPATEQICYAVFILIIDIALFVISFTPIYDLIQINRCRFLVFEDKLLSMGEERVKRRRNLSAIFDRSGDLGALGSYAKVFNFRDYGQYIVTGRDINAYNYSSPEDLFIIVSLDVPFNDVHLIYNKKVYDFQP